MVEALRSHLAEQRTSGLGATPGVAMSVGLLLITHNRIGAELLGTATRMLGTCPLAATTIAVSERDDPDLLRGRGTALYRRPRRRRRCAGADRPVRLDAGQHRPPVCCARTTSVC
jgi:hypothetical protein